MLKAFDLVALEKFMTEVKKSNFQHKAELLLYMNLILETGIRFSEIESIKLLGNGEIEIHQTKFRNSFGKVRKAYITKITEHNLEHYCSAHCRRGSSFRKRSSKLRQVQSDTKKYFGDSFRPLTEMRRLYMLKLVTEGFDNNHIHQSIAVALGHKNTAPIIQYLRKSV